jgi:transcriptional regulator with XRE-family HTH domain
MKKLGKFMKENREAMDLSLRDASKLSGVSHTHIRDIEDGRSIPSFEMVMKFLKAYTVDIGIPIISWTQAGNWQEICDTSQYGEYVETDAKGIFALRVRGESMETEFHEGDIIVTNRDKYLAAVICYIHLNPVEARESDDPKDYSWSSHHHYLGHRAARPWLSVGEVLKCIGNSTIY